MGSKASWPSAGRGRLGVHTCYALPTCRRPYAAFCLPAFERFVNAREENFFGEFEEYVITDYEIDADFGVASVTKEFLFEGIPQTVFSYYDQYGQAMYATVIIELISLPWIAPCA